ncbi:MAG: protein translocase subunit SecD [Patescibacteria group bacterium]
MSDHEETQSQSSSPQTETTIRLFRSLVIVAVVGWLAWFVYQNAVEPERGNPFQLGLDLAGGAHLVYEADASGVDPQEVPELMRVLRDVIERRINLFGVSEPIVQVERSSFVTEEPIERLVVELPGVTDVSDAVAEIGRTPLLEFKLYSEDLAAEYDELQNVSGLLEAATSSATSTLSIETPTATSGATSSATEQATATPPLPFVDTGLTGRYLETANLEFAGGQGGQLSNEPLVAVRFTPEGRDLFAEITQNNVGQQLGIFLDGELLSAPVINEPITGGTAIISGGFTPDEARDLAQNLSFGALPLPIELQSTQTIGASLGAEVLEKGVRAALLGFTLVLVFMLLWYRLPGLIAGIALVSYITIMLALFQLIPVTLTAAGLAGFVLSLGMAVDANVLVFERLKEEYRSGVRSREAARVGFNRAWSAIRDGNLTSLLSAIILFWFGTSLVQGFALVFGLGVLVSMFSALVVTRTLLLSLPETDQSQSGLLARSLGCGLKK